MTTPTFIRRLHAIALAVASITSIAFLSAGMDNPQGAAQAPGVRFRAEQIAADFGVGYAVVTADVNGDGRLDVLAINATDLVWFEAPSWQKHVMLAGATVRDNVTLAPHDIDGDGRIDVALGAGWTGANTGTLQWVRQGAPGASPAWEMFAIAAEPTLHRIRWADVDGDRRLELIVAPLHGQGTKGPNWDGPGARLLIFRPPANPRTEPWPMEVASDVNHILHNFIAMNVDADPQEEIVTASREGLFVQKREREQHLVAHADRRGCARRSEARTSRRTQDAGHRRTLARQLGRDLRRGKGNVDADGDRDRAHRRPRVGLGRLRRRRLG